MTEKKYHKSEIAKSYLEMAVRLFLLGMDRSSVISLAGAASEILDRLVRNQGKEPFIDYACRVHRELQGFTPKRQSYAHHIKKTLGVIAHKHMSESDSATVKLDLEHSAFNTIALCVADYSTLYGQDDIFIRSFLQFAWETTDGKSMMEDFKNVSDRLKPKKYE